MKIDWLVGGLVVLGHAAAAQSQNAEIRHGNRRLPGMLVTDKDGKKIIMVDNAAATEKEIPGVIIYIDSHSSVIRTTTEPVRVRPLSRPRPTAGPREKKRPDLSPPTATTTTTTTTLRRAHPAQKTKRPKPAAAAAAPARLAPAPPPPPPPTTFDQPSPPNITITGGTATGVTYSPYNPDGSCRSASQIASDFLRIAALQSPPFSVVRIYGVDCDQVSSSLAAADVIGVRLFLGLFSLDDLSAQLDTLITAVAASSRGWAAVDTVSVGNELVNNGQATAAQVVGAVAAARARLRAAGFGGPVVTVDTFLAVERNPALCDASDYCAVNVHPFFDGSVAAEEAGAFVARKVADVRAVLGDKGMRIVVTESGWPWQGNANGRAVPGRERQAAAVRSLVAVGNEGGLFLFSAFDDRWKKAEAWTYYAEPFWGMGSM
ncbi:glycoside hydrolase superfamily [Schizothecium vesticola]|uniref:Glycoside hydrolase superfamily n=1 Tax=Schizothecium vesticola TaxID=314040 RepID=A0AA40K8D9_9PEZI|nr:glycoside hydrolase superfamily [Schizothecium vesticola]